MVKKNGSSTVVKPKLVTKKKRTRNVNGWKKAGSTKSIVTKVNPPLQKDLLVCIEHYNIQAPTDIFRMLVHKEAQAILALKGVSLTTSEIQSAAI